MSPSSRIRADVYGLESRHRVLARNGAPATVGVQNREPERSLPEPRDDNLRATVPLAFGRVWHPRGCRWVRRGLFEAGCPETTTVRPLEVDDRAGQFCGLKLSGTSSQASGSKKVQSVTATHPMESERRTWRRASRASLSKSSGSSRVPFACPKTSHARQTGRDA